MLCYVVSGLCAGVRVLYGESGEGKRGKKWWRELVTLESIHSKLWSHPDFHMFSSLAHSTKGIYIYIMHVCYYTM